LGLGVKDDRFLGAGCKGTLENAWIKGEREHCGSSYMLDLLKNGASVKTLDEGGSKIWG
jgi:hypothetical protein